MAEKPESDKDDGASGAASQRDKTVPLAALEAEREKRQALEREMAELRGTVEGLKATRKEPEPVKEPPVFTRAQLKQAVAEGRISEAEMDAILDKQQADQVKRQATVTAAEIVTSTTATAAVAAEIGRYTQALPELADRGSDAYKAVKAKFDRLVAHGSPSSLATELAALEAVYGGPEKLQKPRRADPESHEDVGGSAGASEGSRSANAGRLKDFTPREKDYYGRMIDRGIIKDWDAARDMLKRATPDLRTRNADRIYRRAG